MEKQETATVAEDTSQPYVGRWHRLVSTTNWEKGRIIHEWRSALIASGAPATEYSDEAWSRKVGGITGQHAGRLRRVYDRFGDIHEQFEGLYWSHFQAALDWDDAEMWLEGAAQNKWSVSQLRRQRWETMGQVGQEPQEDEVVASELDEDFTSANDQPQNPHSPHAGPDQAGGGSSDEGAEPRSPAGPDFGDEPDVPSRARAELMPADGPAALDETVAVVRPFEQLAELPEDLAEAFESFKLAILRHKSDNWTQISCDDLLASLDALKALATAPSADQLAS